MRKIWAVVVMALLGLAGLGNVPPATANLPTNCFGQGVIALDPGIAPGIGTDTGTWNFVSTVQTCEGDTPGSFAASGSGNYSGNMTTGTFDGSLTESSDFATCNGTIKGQWAGQHFVADADLGSCGKYKVIGQWEPTGVVGLGGKVVNLEEQSDWVSLGVV